MAFSWITKMSAICKNLMEVIASTNGALLEHEIYLLMQSGLGNEFLNLNLPYCGSDIEQAAQTS